MLKNKSVCLIVDNPLRDLNGLVLLAYQLASRGGDVWLVPMYDQWNEIQAIRPTAVMMNYLRENNSSHVLSYLQAGMMVGVLETEGVGGRSLDEYRQLISTTGYANLLDLYCFWGPNQSTVLLENGVLPESIAKITGCPRYDFCAEPWRQLLLNRQFTPYVLINTSFPTVNPRFSAGDDAEIVAMVSAGFPADFAAQYIKAARHALKGIIELLEVLLAQFPDRHFVLRPHPFESPDGYQSLRRFSNLEIRQEGTSLEWVAHAEALIHLNCSTAIEAKMLGVPVLSPIWLDAPPLHVPLVSNLSQHYGSVQDFSHGLNQALSDRAGMVREGSTEAIESYYFRIDGKASDRVADAIMAAMVGKGANGSKVFPKVPFGFKVKAVLKSIAGTKFFHALARRQKKIVAKSFSVQQVASLLAGIHQLNNENSGAVEMSASLSKTGSSVLVSAR